MAHKYIALALFLFFSAVAISQKTEVVKVSVDTVIIGKNFWDHTNITGKRYVFSIPVTHCVYDTVSGNLITVLRNAYWSDNYYDNDGKLIVYNTSEDMVKWWRDINYSTSGFSLFGDKIFLIKYKTSYLLDMQNGSKRWKTNNVIFSCFPDYNIGFGYHDQTQFTNAANTLHGIDLSTGKDLWTRYIPRNYDWNDVIELNDSVILIVAKGLHTVNIVTGKGWDYQTSTGIDDYVGATLPDITDTYGRLFTRNDFYPEDYKVIIGIASNIKEDSTGFYFVSKNKVAKVTKRDGNQIWAYFLDKNFAGKSKIFIRDSVLYIVGFGYGFWDNHAVATGVPYFAAFNKNTGKKLFFNSISEKEKAVVGFTVSGNSVTVVFNQRIARYRVSDGTAILNKPEFGTITKVIDSNYFIQNSDSTYTPVVKSNAGKLFVYTGSKKMLAIDSTLKVIEETDFRKVYHKLFEYGNHIFIQNDEAIIILDNNFRKTAVINLKGELNIFGDKIFMVEECKNIRDKNNVIEVMW